MVHYSCLGISMQCTVYLACVSALHHALCFKVDAATMRTASVVFDCEEFYQSGDSGNIITPAPCLPRWRST